MFKKGGHPMSHPTRRFAFTKRSIEAIPAHDLGSPSREAEYSDAECIGLHLRVSKNGRRFFQHRYRYLGRKKCLSLGEFPHVSVQDARQRVSEHKALLARDIDPGDERAQRRNDITFAAFARDFYIPHAKMHKKTWQEDVWKIERQLEPAFGKLMLSSVLARDISSFHNKEKQRTSSTTANHHMTLIKRMFNLAVKWGLLEKSPAAGLDKFKEPPHRERYLTKEELPRFLKALDEQEDKLSVAAIKLLLFTGGRKNEILSLQWSQVKLDEKRLFLPNTKNGRSRSIILNDKAVTILRELDAQRDCHPRAKESTYLIPSRNGAKKPYIYDLRKPFVTTCEAAGIEGLRIHDLRHSFATLAIQGGASLYDVQKLLGHSDISMTQRYAHMADESLQRATDNMAGVIDRAIGE
jgi:integrase